MLDFADQLAAIATDSEVRRLALIRAGSRELAEDALMETYCAIAARDPSEIKNLRAYFYIALIREIDHQRSSDRSIPFEDLAELPDHRRVSLQSSGSFEQGVYVSLLVEKWFSYLEGSRERLTAAVPGRSPDPDAYRAAIYRSAVKILRSVIDGSASQSDMNRIIVSEYPDWHHGAEFPSTTHQRISRARRDVQAMLRSLMDRDELIT